MLSDVASCARQLVHDRHSLEVMAGAYEALYRQTVAHFEKPARLSVGAGRA